VKMHHILIASKSCHSQFRQPWHNTLELVIHKQQKWIFYCSGGQKVQDQGASRFSVWWGLSALLIVPLSCILTWREHKQVPPSLFLWGHQIQLWRWLAYALITFQSFHLLWLLHGSLGLAIWICLWRHKLWAFST
jgi:hypothetical protein